MNAADALRLHAEDTVAVLLRDAEAGENLRWRDDAASGEVTAREPIPLGHKISLAAVETDADVLKYGAVIGRSSRPITPGDHVHVHNLLSIRARRAP